MHADTFTDQLRILGALPHGHATDRVLNAFRAVPREAFTGPGPWKFRSPHDGFTLPIQCTPDDNPKWLYNSVLIVLDEEKGINIGDPVFWARRFVRANIEAGIRILQVGAGVGYYTAILSRLVGPKGSIVAYEIEHDLAKRAQANLSEWPNVEVRHGNAATDLRDGDQFDLIVAFAGITQVPEMWTLHLAPEARILVPLTGDAGWGAMILAEKREHGFDAVTIGGVGIYPCTGARDHKLAKQITDLFEDRSRLNNCRLKLEITNGTTRIDLD